MGRDIVSQVSPQGWLVVDQHHLGAGLGSGQSRRHARRPAADHRHVDMGVLVADVSYRLVFFRH